MIRIAVLGSKGFLAKHWLEFSTLAKKKTTTLVRLDSRIESSNDIDQALRAIDAEKPSHILNFIGSTDSEAPAFSLINEELPRRLLENSEPDCDVILFGSAAEYGSPDRLPVDETSSLKPLTAYAKAKVAQTNCFRKHQATRKAHLLRAFNTIGKNQPKGQLFHHLILRALNARQTSKFTLREPELIRDFIDVRDVVSAIDAVIQSNDTSFEADLCSGKPLSIRDLALKMIESIKPAPNWAIEEEIVTNRSPVLEIWGSPAALQSRTGWRPERSIEDSLNWALRDLF